MSRAIVALLMLTLVRPVFGADTIDPDRLTDQHVRLAISALVEELYRRKQPEHFWDPAAWTSQQHGSSRQKGGYTALAVLSLLYTGQSYQDPRLKDAIAYLQSCPLEGTYAVAVRAHVWAMLGQKFLPDLERDVRWLMQAFSNTAPGWDYGSNPETNRQDNSLRQYGALGLWEAVKRGARIDPRYWQRLEQAFVASQQPDGGWNYRGDDAPPRGSMTAAGLTVLFITQDLLHSSDYLEPGAHRETPADLALAKGLRWMDEHFSATTHPGRDAKKDFYYYLYGVERVGLASGYKFFGGKDWYRQSAAEIIGRLCQWDAETSTLSVRNAVTRDRQDTEVVKQIAFALMFLSRGRSAVAFNKLDVPGMAWNNRPRDVANLCGWISGILEPTVNWQVVSIETEPDSWLDAPILYLASHEALPFVPTQEQPRRSAAQSPDDERDQTDVQDQPTAAALSPELTRLRHYLDLGGLLFAVNEGKSSRFADSVRRLGTLLYPQYVWRPLPDDHWVYTIHRPVRGRKPKFEALSNGVRELIVLAPGPDLARAFQSRDEDRENDFHSVANLYFYASEMTRQQPRLARPARLSQTAPGPEASVTVVRARYEGNWNPEPEALPVLADFLRAQRRIEVLFEDQPLDRIDTLTPAPSLVTVSGTTAHEFSPRQREAIAKYVEGGGVVLFETPGGQGDFTASAEAMAESVFGQAPQSINQSRIVTGEGLPKGQRLARIGYRPFAVQQFGIGETAPRLRGIAPDETSPRVLFSREDLSQGILDQPCWGVLGYQPESARALMGNIVEHALLLSSPASPDRAEQPGDD